MFDFSRISNATNNFSAENKLGEGGFGPVYKVNVCLFVLYPSRNGYPKEQMPGYMPSLNPLFLVIHVGAVIEVLINREGYIYIDFVIADV